MEDVDFDLLSQQLKALTEDVPYETANLANASALLWQTLPRINWAGFYKMTEGRLVLGPFQGKPAQLIRGSVCHSSAEALARLAVS